ncbi:unnamed protein product [Rhizophagus irregularis]|uniref:Uncharacterized protein n=1 Tax=Rhizophagus irregularis TaxID=588596 RepID=A0A915ZF06_9GLOM|nr:unnamed protein product [Rhizophagus irregularis]CAB4482805.1 unnamed protein product [Rhizophagus irregularis]CAB5199086.1 unnamed protein product [Rhizophagus irregularis]CAB5372314.1 unnamed protein product [Rhizophagus irregularis]CAB5380570.1 unnamed protein product [Rhizophagus irregularis]
MFGPRAKANDPFVDFVPHSSQMHKWALTRIMKSSNHEIIRYTFFLVRKIIIYHKESYKNKDRYPLYYYLCQIEKSVKASN